MKTKNSNPILITGGHMTPALAVLAELKKRGYTNFLWVGHKYNQQKNRNLSPEYQIVKSENILFINLRTGKLIRKFHIREILYVIKQLILIPIGFFTSLLIIYKFKPRIILSFGGFLALPIVIAAKIFRIPVITHEQTIVSGLANRIIARFADKVLISWKESFKYFDKSKTILTGNPIRKEVLNSKVSNFTKNLNKNLKTILVYGGNQGSHLINEVIFELLPMLLKKYNVIHQTGNSSVTNDYVMALSIQRDLPFDQKSQYIPKDYISGDEVGEVLNNSDIIVGRAGANSVSEYLLLGKMCILIPIPWTSHNEQNKNARLVKSCGLGEIIAESNLNKDSLLKVIKDIDRRIENGLDLFDKEIEESRRYAKTLIITDAHKLIVDVIEEKLH